MSGYRLVAALALVGFASQLAAQAPSVELGKRSAKSKYTLGHVTALRELPDGRVVVADSKDGVFRLVDLAKGDVTLIGKPGDGPDEYRTAIAILPLPADSLMLLDAAGRKFLHLSPAGTLAGIVPLTVTSSRTQRNSLPAAADRSGALYYLTAEFDTVARAMKPTASLRRLAPGASADVEVARVTTRRADQVKLSGMVPFVFRDAWAVRDDGLIARAVSDTYQVVWIRDGKESGRTGPIPYSPIEITAAEQQAIRDSLKAGVGRGGPMTMIAGPANAPVGAGRGVAVADGGGGGQQTFVFRGGGGDGGGAGGVPMVITGGAPAGGGSTQVIIGGPPGGDGAGKGAPDGAAGGRGTPPSAADMQKIQDMMAKMADVPAENFPPTKPAIPSSGLVAIFDANGMLWVARERVRGDAIPKYDVIAEGKGVVAQVKLPAGTRLLGFGKGVVYLARTEDGDDWVERYPMPK